MNTILVSLNSKYIHSNLAIRYLSKYVSSMKRVDIYEFTINQSPEFIASEIYRLSPNLVGFSTYIWNLKETLGVCEILKLVKPDLKILLGGPEVSYDGEIIMEEYPFIDYIIYGEGEETFKEFLQKEPKGELEDIRGLIYREGDRIIKNPERDLIMDLNTIPFPYDEGSRGLENRIVYYESSRGCPFNCQYCLSSTIRGVRYLDLDRVKRDLSFLIDEKVKQVKFVDRTFNANKEHAMEILKFIKEKDPDNINFHFEITAHLIDQDFLDLLKDVKEGLFQFEIGVQSTNDETIDAIKRTTDFTQLSDVVRTIKSFKNIHLHLDLIAGLPYEGYDSFKESFNDVYNLRPEKLQLGFLKLLKGSGLRLNQAKHGYKYIDEPPYQVLESKYISYGDLLKLKDIEDLVEKYYNEGYFENALNYLIKEYYNSPFDFYEDFSSYWVSKAYHKIFHSRDKLYKILLEFVNYKEFKDEFFVEVLKFDYLLNNKNPKLNFNKDVNFRLNLHDLLKNEDLLDEYLYEFKDMPTKKLINRVVVEAFKFNILGAIGKDFEEKKQEESYILFLHRDGVISRGSVYDISRIVREMI
ncbi:MAG: DUF4080 domain-containing protein [Tissierellia bacterium]|nr:DUF4080 domain-containing protein [Tissierellia bacterium]